MNFMGGCIFNMLICPRLDIKLLWEMLTPTLICYLTTLQNNLINIRNLLKQTPMPEDLCDHSVSHLTKKGGSRKTSVMVQASKSTLIELLPSILFSPLMG